MFLKSFAAAALSRSARKNEPANPANSSPPKPQPGARASHATKTREFRHTLDPIHRPPLNQTVARPHRLPYARRARNTARTELRSSEFLLYYKAQTARPAGPGPPWTGTRRPVTRDAKRSRRVHTPRLTSTARILRIRCERLPARCERPGRIPGHAAKDPRTTSRHRDAP